ncbi:uncharacterized protein K452DRAFT_360896 [Aplosporella prunicola CBS 121167]|uniref:Uncharacterized protein n=1 Tax=Aplosporella prunicola CBS 121167 TaxID=1176127 RepID=A0A6A6B4S5_9PEZI|nr:uncharacterized protein K452DRAFT_360896 [Aplosporella prunicola CBS 121167]KAF2139199.1 hypothetical protein K452DRAFT_360896 [Aplosporella prunicola CBS 121167]
MVKKRLANSLSFHVKKLRFDALEWDTPLKPLRLAHEQICSFNVGKDGESLYVPGTPPNWARKPLPRNTPLLPRVRHVTSRDPLLRECHFTPMLTALAITNPAYNLSDVFFITTSALLQKLMELIQSNQYRTIPEAFKVNVSMVGNTALMSLDVEKPWERTAMQEEFTEPKPGWEDSYVHCRAIRYKLHGLDVIVEHPVDADTSQYRSPTRSLVRQRLEKPYLPQMLFPPKDFKGRPKKTAPSGRVVPPAKPGEDTRLGDSNVHFCGFGTRPDRFGSIRPLSSQHEQQNWSPETFYKEKLRRADLWFNRSPMSLNYAQDPHRETVDGIPTDMHRVYGHRIFTMDHRHKEFAKFSAKAILETELLLFGLRKMAKKSRTGSCQVYWSPDEETLLQRQPINLFSPIQTVPVGLRQQFWPGSDEDVKRVEERRAKVLRKMGVKPNV